MVLLALIAVLLACGLTWLFFGRSEHNGYWPKKRDE